MDRLISWAEVTIIAAALLTALVDTVAITQLLLVGGLSHLLLGQLWLRVWWWWIIAAVFSHGFVPAAIYWTVYSSWYYFPDVPVISVVVFLGAMGGLLAQSIIRMSAGIPSRHLRRHSIVTAALVLPFVAIWLV